MKYFVVSDIHSFYDELISSLKAAGYDKENPNHCLIVNGDLFDRGTQTIEVLNFIKSIPTTNRILVRGNHEGLLFDLISKSFPEAHDFTNGTVQTAFHLYMDKHPNSHFLDVYKTLKEKNAEFYKKQYKFEVQLFNDIMQYNITYDMWAEVCRNLISDGGILPWIYQTDEWCNFVEIDKYIITHAFIPVIDESNNYTDRLSYNPNWRNDKEHYTNSWDYEYDWYRAMWDSPIKKYDLGLFQPEADKGKILICGHWHANLFHKHYNKQENNNDMYISKNLIAIDACTILSHKVNVYVFESDAEVKRG